MSAPVRPWFVAHRGAVDADAVLVRDDGDMDDPQRRVLTIWGSGSSLWRVDEGWVVRFAAPRRCRPESMGALPLVETSGVLYAAPLVHSERSALAAPPGSVVTVRGGEARILATTTADPSTWLDLSEFRAVDVAPLARPVVAVEAAPQVSLDVASILDTAIGPRDRRVVEVLRALQDARSGRAQRPGFWQRLWERVRGTERVEVSEVDAFAPAGPARRPPSWFARMMGRVARAMGQVAEHPGTAPAGQSFVRRETLRDKLARWAWRSSLGGLLGQQYARYLDRMMSMFEDGDMLEGLRHAIPLGLGGAGGGGAPRFGLPRPRSDLSIATDQGASGGSLFAVDGLFERLQRMYRRAFERLDAQGRVDEAAFVLLELLGADQEGVDYLVDKGRFRQAAEVAEGRNMSASLVVRLWFRAHERDRAVLHARRTGAFSTAVAELERRDPEAGRALRVLWAEWLAGSGQYLAAVETVWAVEEARGLATRWLRLGAESGGPAGARLLAHWVAYDPTTFDMVHERMAPVLLDDTLERLRERSAFTQAVSRLGRQNEALVTLARAAARASVRDAAQHVGALPRHELEQILRVADDGALAEDMPPLVDLHPTMPELPRIDHHVGRREVGAGGVFDAVGLPNGRVLLALGELGALLVDRDGRRLASFDQPAERIVISEHAHHAIVLARRDERWRLARVDLARKRAESWCLAELTNFCSQHDGSVWYAATDDSVVAVDVQSAGLRSLWKIPDVGGAGELSVWRGHLSFVDLGADMVEAWTLELPEMTVRSRRPIDPVLEEVPGRTLALVPMPDEGFGLLRHEWDGETGEHYVRVRRFSSDGEPLGHLHVDRGLFLVDADSAGCARHRDWLVAWTRRTERDGVRVRVHSVVTDACVADIELEGAGRVSAHILGALMTLSDDCGRVIVYDLPNVRIVSDLRV